MKDDAPLEIAAVAAAVGLGMLDLAAGFALQFVRTAERRRAAAWLLVATNVALTAAVAGREPPGVRMLAMIGTLLLAMKSAVIAAAEDGAPPLPPVRWLAFAAAWPGMDPEPFRHRAALVPDGASKLIRRGAERALYGAAAILLARVVWKDFGSRALATPPLLLGLSLLLHFGIFDVLAGLWRRAGVDCRPLFRAPLAARSLGEFWSRRWNLAFSEMTRAAVYRPLCAHLGRTGATLGAFLFSGALHELAISYPVGAGYGLPTLYFALHGCLVAVERRIALDRHPVLGRCWTLFWLAMPLPLLFHPAFLDGVVWPLIGMGTRR